MQTKPALKSEKRGFSPLADFTVHEPSRAPLAEKGRAKMRTTAGEQERPPTSANVRGAAKPGGRPKSKAARERAIIALIAEKTLAAAARRSGVNERTLRRWITGDEDFQRELAEARRACFRDGLDRVRALFVHAIDTLASLMRPSAPPAVRLGAARTVAELAIQQDETENILGRLEELETRQRSSETRGWHQKGELR